jgi:hypothetical protein
LTPQEAQAQLGRIREVMDRARAERVRGGDIYVAWGVVIVLCILATLGADAAGWPWGWVSFPVLCTLTGIWTGVRSRALGLQRMSYGGKIEASLWGAVSLGLVALLGGGLATGVLALEAVVPVVTVLTGAAVLVSGTAFGERMLQVSGAGFVLLAAPCFLLPWRTQYALFAVALVVGYIVPGVILVRRERAAA